MMQTKILFFFLLIAVAQIQASESKEKSSDESSDLLKEKHFYDKEKNHEKIQHEGHKDADLEKKHQHEENYKKWNKKRNTKNYSDASNSIRTNEINSDEHLDKYENTHKSKYVDKKMKKEKNKHDKNYLHIDKHSAHNEKTKNLLNDVNINYISSDKKTNRDSEIINFHNNENVNHVGDNKKNHKDVEIITNIPVTSKSKEIYEQNYQNDKNQLYLKRHKKNFYQNLRKINLSVPPANNTVLMARYIIHTIDWAAVGTLSKKSSTKGTPFVCVKAISDGTPDLSTGIPFFYLSPMDICTQDLQEDNRASVLVTLSETEYCKNKNLDPQDPRCAKMTLSGKIKKIKAGSDEEKFAKNALFTRHPAMATWPRDHNWYFAKLKIGQIVLLDKFGGANYINVKDYLNGGTVGEPEV